MRVGATHTSRANTIARANSITCVFSVTEKHEEESHNLGVGCISMKMCKVFPHLYCGTHICCIFKISTQQLINWALSGLSISGRNSTSQNICSPPSSNLSSSFSIRSWVSQVCPALDLNQCLYLPDIHTSAVPRTSQCTYITRSALSCEMVNSEVFKALQNVSWFKFYRIAMHSQHG